MLPDETLQDMGPVRHLASGRPVTLAAAYAPQYAGGGRDALTDGLKGEATHRDSAWQGFHGVDLDAVIDLGAAVSSPRVEVTFLQEVPVGIYLPTDVVLSASQDGKAFIEVRTVTPEVSGDGNTAFVRSVTARFDGVSPRYLRVRARNRGTIPEGHRAAGAPAWLFVDEITVKSGP
jgi:hypothetical protein